MKQLFFGLLVFALGVGTAPESVIRLNFEADPAFARGRGHGGHVHGGARPRPSGGARTRPSPSRPKPSTRPAQARPKPSRPTTRPATKPSTRPATKPATRPNKPTTRPTPGSRPEGARPPGNRPPGSRPPGSRPPGAQRPPGSRPPGGNRPPGSRPPGGNRPPGSRPPGHRPPGSRPPGHRPPPGYRPPHGRPPGYRPPPYRPPYYRPPHPAWGPYYYNPSWGWFFTAALVGSTLVYVNDLPDDKECQKVNDGGETLYNCDGTLYRSTYYKDEKVYEIASDAPEESAAGPTSVVGLALTEPMTRGEVVRDLQNRLVAAGYDVGGVDGVFGSGTEAALQWLQYDNGLDATGFVDAETARLLGYGPADGVPDAPPPSEQPASTEAPAAEGETQTAPAPAEAPADGQAPAPATETAPEAEPPATSD